MFTTKLKKGPAQSVVEGFTLAEIALVVTAIAILAAIVVVSINPSKKLSATNDSQRRSDITTILNAVSQYAIANKGAHPAGISTEPRDICKTNVTPERCATINGVDLSILTDREIYISTMPQDPVGGINSETTGYFISKTADNRINITAVFTEQDEKISVTR